MLYSHLNPLVYLIVLKKFQQYHIDVFIYSRNTLFFEEVQQIGSSNDDKQPTRCSKKNRIMRLGGFFLFFVAVFGLCLISHYQLSSENDTALVKTASFSATLRRNFQLPFKTRNRIDYNQLQPYSHHIDEQCDENQAVFNYNRKRCYFVLRVDYPGYNLTESIEQCFSRGAVLSYPRHWEEVSDLWIYFNSHLQRTDKLNMEELLAKTTLHVGFRRNGNFEFRSVDEKLNVSTASHPIMLDTASPFEFNFKGPAICINRYQYLKRCLPRMRNQFAVCSVDF